MSLKTGESGKNLNVGTGFDMSSNTELTLTFTPPDGVIVTKTKTGGQVVLGVAPITDPDVGALAANEYVVYTIEPGFLSQAGTWSVYCTYTNTTPTPDDVFIGDCAKFTVESPC